MAGVEAEVERLLARLGVVAVARAQAARRVPDLELGERLVRRRPQQPGRVAGVLQQRGAVQQLLRRVPDDVADGLLRVDPQEVLQDAQEGDLLRRLHHLWEGGLGL